MTEDEVAAFHEAAHAVFAVFGEWTKLAGPVALIGRGGGDVVMSTDGKAVARALHANPAFDLDLPRIRLIRALLAGPIAERLLSERGLVELSAGDLDAATRDDYAIVAEQFGQLASPRPGLLADLEREVREKLERPVIWSAVEGFAAILLARGKVEQDEASSILDEMRIATGAGPYPLDGRKPSQPIALFAMIAVVLILAIILG